MIQALPTSSPIRAQKRITALLLTSPNRRWSYEPDHATVECLCGLHNLGIARLDRRHVTLRSADKARRYLQSIA